MENKNIIWFGPRKKYNFKTSSLEIFDNNQDKSISLLPIDKFNLLYVDTQKLIVKLKNINKNKIFPIDLEHNGNTFNIENNINTNKLLSIFFDIYHDDINNYNIENSDVESLFNLIKLVKLNIEEDNNVEIIEGGFKISIKFGFFSNTFSIDLNKQNLYAKKFKDFKSLVYIITNFKLFKNLP